LQNAQDLARILGFDQAFLVNWGLQIINTLVLAFVLTKLLYNPVKSFMKKRADRISEQIDKAEGDLKQAQEMKALYEDKLKYIDKERNEILDRARIQAIEKERGIIEEAKAEAEKIKNRAKQDIEREQVKAKDEIKKQIIDLSTLMAERYIAVAMNPEEQDKLLDKAIADLGAVQWKK